MTPNPNLQAAAMRTRAADEATAWVRRAMYLSPNGYEIERYNGHMVTKASEAILALTLEATSAELLAEAVKLPEIAALVSKAQASMDACYPKGRPWSFPAKTVRELSEALAPFAREAGV
jgi:hypothetical protein